MNVRVKNAYTNKGVKVMTFKRKPVMVIDFWRILDKELGGVPGVTYIPVGRSTEDYANEALLKELWGTALG